MGWRLANRLGPDQGDPIFYVYLLKWVAHRLPEGLAGLWNPPFFHPMPGVLALSDHLLGPGVAFAALRAAGLPALAAYNLLYAGAYFLAGLAAWWVLRRSGLSAIAAVAGGWLFAFGHFRWDEQSHFNVLLTGAIPLVLWSFDRLLERPSWGRAAGFAAAYALHLSGSVYLAYLIHFPLLVLLLNRRDAIVALRRRARAAAPLAAAAAWAVLLLAALYTGYSKRAESLHAARELTEMRSHSPIVASFAQASQRSPLARGLPEWPDAAGRGALFPGLAILAGAAVALGSGWRRYRRPLAARPAAPWIVAALAGAAIVGVGLHAADHFTLTGDKQLWGIDLHDYRGPLLLLLVGATLFVVGQRRARGGEILESRGLQPWPRGLARVTAVSLALCLPAVFWLPWSILPGMEGMRISHRFFPFAALGLGWAAGRGIDLLRARFSSRIASDLVAAAFLLVVVLEHRPHLRAWQPLVDAPDFPAYTRFLAESPEVRSYVSLPMYGDWRDLRTMYFGSEHWRPLVNGSSSFLPRSRFVLGESCSRLGGHCLDELRRWRVSHLVLDREPLPASDRRRRRVEAARARVYAAAAEGVRDLVAAGELIPIFESERADVYRFAPAELTPPADEAR